MNWREVLQILQHRPRNLARNELYAAIQTIRCNLIVRRDVRQRP
jgi:hypothetical protein